MANATKKRRAPAAVHVTEPQSAPSAAPVQTELVPPAPVLPTDLRVLPVGALIDSPFQHRREYTGLDELAESLRSHGVLQPLVVRPSVDDLFELVCGHRRLRAARLAGLAEVPCIVRTMDDRAVIEAQVIENVQRVDVDPLDEADGYRLLIEAHGLAIAEVARRTGRTERLIQRRLRLATLPDEARSRLRAGDILIGHAELVAALPSPALQQKALEYLLSPPHRYQDPAEPVRSFERMPLATFERFVVDELLVRLDEATFDPADAELVPSAGACTSCPKRSGAQRALFPDAVGDDACTDPPCFWLKTKVKGTRLVEERVAEGARLVPAKKAKGLFRPDGELDWRAAQHQIDLDSPCYTGGGKLRTWAERLGVDKALAAGEKSPVVISVAQDDHGRVHRLAPKDRCEALLASIRGAKETDGGDRQADKDVARERAKRKKERELARETGARFLAALDERMFGKEADQFVVRLLAWLLRERLQRGSSLFAMRPQLVACALRVTDDAKQRDRIQAADGREQQDLAVKALLVWAFAFLCFEGANGAASVLARAALLRVWVELELAPELNEGGVHAFMAGSVPATVGRLLDIEVPAILAGVKKDRAQGSPKGTGSTKAAPAPAVPDERAARRRARPRGKDAASGERDD